MKINRAKDLVSGIPLLKRIGQLLFSEGTYQVEILDPKTKQSIWPFLQLDDAGELIDCFCTCKDVEKKKICKHLAAALLKIFNKKKLPLHVRFRDSLWNRLCQMASRRHGYSSKMFKKHEQSFDISSSTGKHLFSLKGLTQKGRKKVESILFNRTLETEETSLKFSNLPFEELQLWREGHPSPDLQYELSFWSDLAKWWMLLEEEAKPYTITFEQEDEQLPHGIVIAFADVRVKFYIATASWPSLIPSLASVRSPLHVFEFQQHKIQSIRYDSEKESFFIKSKPLEGQMPGISPHASLEKGIPVGADWVYVNGKGFFPLQVDALFNQPEISREKIGYLLQKHAHLIEKYLVGTKIHLTGVNARYDLFFDKQEQLHICCYVFEKGDLSQKGALYFGPWVYLPQKGFYRLENLLFDGVEKMIPRAELNDFINNHRVWLNEFEGFHTHVFALESQLRYRVNEEGFLLFESVLELTGMENAFIDFRDWVYIEGKGFFAKKMGRISAFIRPDMPIAPSDVSAFIRVHAEELEMIKGFFTDKSPLQKSGVEISLSPNHVISVRPHFHFYPSYREKNVRIFGDYTFVETEGFCEIPSDKKLPSSFLQQRTIAPQDEIYFVLYELDMLKPFITSIQDELVKPKYLSLRILKLKRAAKNSWIMQALFESDLGQVPIYTVWKAIVENKRYLFSPCGLILLRVPRFNWLKNTLKRQWLQKGKFLKLRTLDWMRLCAMEEVLPPSGNTAEEKKTKQHIDALYTFNTDEPIDLTGLKSDLRAYQILGVRWLYFLHTFGLSGLLCDEMGLGKTHQAMGLLAAIHNEGTREDKFLVICPTSVIYHWEELLKTFLPHMRIAVFYGSQRTLDNFTENADLLLTSYGILRSEKQALSKLPFTVAIFDELQIAKNPHSQTHKALRKIDALTRIGLTGTPIENRLLELKSLFDIILPGYMPHEAQFKEFFVNPIEKGQDIERKVLLSRLTKPFILRRKKAEVLLELPEKIEEIAYTALSDEQKELYKQAVMQHQRASLKSLDEGPLPLVHIFALFSTLKQICDHPCLITKQFNEFQKHSSGKWDLFVELLKETRDSGQKLVIFSQYLNMLDLFAHYLDEQKIGFASIRGSTRDRKAQLEKFRTDSQCEVFLASLQAAGVGIDLVSASVVIHYDRWWNPARENQATDRVHRIGQNRGVQVFKMVTKNTIEEHIHHMIEKKMTLLEEVISFDEEDHIKGLNREEILELLRLLDQDIK